MRKIRRIPLAIKAFVYVLLGHTFVYNARISPLTGLVFKHGEKAHVEACHFSGFDKAFSWEERSEG